MTTESDAGRVRSNDQLGLVARLRAPSMTDTTATHIDRMRKAADEIERLRARLEKAEDWAQRAMLMRSSQNAELLRILRGEA